MCNLIPLFNIGFPRDIVHIIHGHRKNMFRQRIENFELMYRHILYLKQYVVPDINGNVIHYIINHTPSFWTLPYSYSLSYYRFTKYGRYVMWLLNDIKITDNVKFDKFPIDFI